jgi:hypothetical protein
MWARFNDLFDSAVHYCNSADAERYSNFFYQNGKVDEVVIQSDGVSDQKGRKTDVQAVVNTTDPATGKVLSRTLKNVDISLKADSKKYGQATAGGLKQSKEVWLANARNVFEPFGVKIDMPESSTDMLSFWINIYKQAADKLDAALTNATANKETAYVEMIANVIQQHGTAGNPNLKLVNFEKGQSTIHSFNQVKKRLIDSKINLAAKFAIGARSGKPTLFIYDKNSNSVLTAIRFYLTDKASTNYFEKGELLDVLTRVEKVRTAPQPVQQPAIPPKQPIATQPATPEVQPELAESRESRILISPPRQRR